MTVFNDVNGLTGIKALKLDGATKWIGQSAVVGAIDATDLSAAIFSLSAYSVNSAVFACNSGTAATISATVAQLLTVLAKQGIITVNYDGTNKVS